jgi:hypothetical protein
MPGPSLVCTLGRRTYWAGFDAIRPSMCATGTARTPSTGADRSLMRRDCVAHVMAEQFDVRMRRSEYVHSRPREEGAKIVPTPVQGGVAVAGEECDLRQLRVVDIAYDENLINRNPIR